MIYRGYTLPNIENTKELNEDLRKHMKQDKDNAFRSNMELYVNMKSFGDITLFLGSFISILFFLLHVVSYILNGSIILHRTESSMVHSLNLE